MSTPRPIHSPSREIRHEPDEKEPSYSYEQKTLLPKPEDEVEDDFYRLRFKGSCWRTWYSSTTSVSPSFPSTNMGPRADFSERKTEEEGPVPRSPPPSNTVEKDLPKSWTKEDAKRKDKSKLRKTARLYKLEAQNSDLDSGRLETRHINLMLDQCETVQFPKLILEYLNLSMSDIPVKDMFNTSLGNSLHKLSLAGNRLVVIPPELVQCLPVLSNLDLSQCELCQLPDKWNLPKLKRLNLSHNRISDFPDESMVAGLPELQDLNMYGNEVVEIIVPHNPRLLSKLETLNLGYNYLESLPDDLDQLKALRTFKVMGNLLERIPRRVCDMDIKVIDVSSNPVIQPPIETCERGMCSMKRYYHCLRNEEQSKHKALDEVQKKNAKRREEEHKFRKMKQFFKSPSTTKKTISEDTPAPHGGGGQALDSVKLTMDVLSMEETKAWPEGAEINHALTVERKQVASLETSSMNTAAADSESFMDDAAVKTKDEVAVNDTLKVIFVGMAMAGKTTIIRRLTKGKDAVMPIPEKRTVGVDIYPWHPKTDADTCIELEDEDLRKTCGDVDVKFSVWDFAGQHVYHATHELFFSPHALYVLVWDMGATNESTLRKPSLIDSDRGNYSLYDFSDDEDDEIMAERRADRALERDIDDKVQFWVDCIQSSVPGAAILLVASSDDCFDRRGNRDEAERRCNVMKSRLLEHEKRQIAGITERWEEYRGQNRANDEGARRLWQLLDPVNRPKLIFGNDEKNSVVRVSGTKFTGFDDLTRKIVHIATGRIFRGHIGAQIPRMRLEVRDLVSKMRDRFKVVEWGYFLSTLRKHGLYSVKDISDALHFLTNIGELSYFGNVLPNKQKMDTTTMAATATCCPPISDEDFTENDGEEVSDDMDEDKEKRRFSMDDVTSSLTTNDGSMSTTDDLPCTGLSQFIFLNPRSLVKAVACILRDDLDREIKYTRRSLMRLEAPRASTERIVERGDSFYETNLNCPVITASDACMLWHAMRFTKKAAKEHSNNLSVTPFDFLQRSFDFLQRLLIRFGVFVPIDLSIDKALLGGKDYAKNNDLQQGMENALITEETADSASFFFLPSLLGPGEPSESWIVQYKNTDSWKTTLCHSVLFPDSVPPGLMERITASVLSSIYAFAKHDKLFRVREILCWRTAFFIKIGTEVSCTDGEIKESVVEIFTHLVDRESHLCVGSDSMVTGMRRLILSGKGQVGDGGRRIWNGGYLLVMKAIHRVMAEYAGLEYEKQGFCPDCLSKLAVSQAFSWGWDVIRTAGQNGDEAMRCRHGHRVDTRLIAGPYEGAKGRESVWQKRRESILFFTENNPIILNELLRGVVLVGLWDGRRRMLVHVGSGFIVDKKRGLIVTASHTLMNICGDDRNAPFGKDYFGQSESKVVIGVIPGIQSSERGAETQAVFRYFARIAAKDPNIDKNDYCQADVCVLQITKRMENDVGGNGEGIRDQTETLLLNNPAALKREKLQQLKVTEKCELQERVGIIGFNQGGEELLSRGERLNRSVDIAEGYVRQKFFRGEEPGCLRHCFKPREEIVVNCPTIGGHSGGPCVNQQGEVIGILSRADPAENQRCYLVPATEWQALVKKAKNNV